MLPERDASFPQQNPTDPEASPSLRSPKPLASPHLITCPPSGIAGSGARRRRAPGGQQAAGKRLAKGSEEGESRGPKKGRTGGDSTSASQAAFCVGSASAEPLAKARSRYTCRKNQQCKRGASGGGMDSTSSFRASLSTSPLQTARHPTRCNQAAGGRRCSRHRDCEAVGRGRHPPKSLGPKGPAEARAGSAGLRLLRWIASACRPLRLRPHRSWLRPVLGSH